MEPSPGTKSPAAMSGLLQVMCGVLEEGNKNPIHEISKFRFHHCEFQDVSDIVVTSFLKLTGERYSEYAPQF